MDFKSCDIEATGRKLHINKNTPLLRSNKKQKAKNSKGRRNSLEKMTQRSERKVEKTFETPYKVFTHSDKQKENNKLPPSCEGQMSIKIKTKEDESLEKKVLKANRKKY